MTVQFGSDKTLTAKGIPAALPEYSNPTNTSSWVRNSEWPALPTVTSTDQKFVGLYAVYNNDSNFVAVLATTSTGTYTVDWGDGTSPQTYTSGVQAQYNYNYATVTGSPISLGYKIVTVTITATTGNLTGISLNQLYTNTPTLPAYTAKWLDISVGSPYLTSLTFASGSLVVNLSMLEQISIYSISSSAPSNMFSTLFAYLYALQSIPVLNTNNAALSSFASLFFNCYKLEVAPNITTTATLVNTSGMFQNCYALKYSPNYTFNIMNPSNMFLNCYSLSKAPMLTFDNTVTSFSSMFNACYELVDVPRYNLPSGTTSTYDMASMFGNCYKLKTVPWMNTTKCNNMNSIFANCRSLIEVPFFDTTNNTGTNGMFLNCYSLTSVPKFITTQSTDFGNMFSGCSSLRTIPQFDTSNGTIFDNMFLNCVSLESVPLLNTINGTSFSSFMSGCNSIKEIPTFNTSNAINLTSFVNSCSALKTFPLINTSNATTFTTMLASTKALTTIPTLNTIKGVTFTSFVAASSISTFPSINLSNGTSFGTMFQNCTNLQYVPTLDTSKGNTFTSMFAGCNGLTELPAMSMANATAATSFASGSGISKTNATGVKVAVGYINCALSKNQLETMFDQLGSPAGATTLTITNNYGADTAVAPLLTSGQAAGVQALTVASTTGMAAGMYVQNATCFAATACTFQFAASTVTKATHGLQNGTRVSFASITTTTGFVINTVYFVVNRTANTFQISLTSGGAPITFATADGTGTMKYEVYITSVTSGTTINISAPTTATTTASALSARYLNTYRATLKNWSVSG